MSYYSRNAKNKMQEQHLARTQRILDQSEFQECFGYDYDETTKNGARLYFWLTIACAAIVVIGFIYADHIALYLD